MEESLLRKHTLGILAGMVGSAVAWWWARQRTIEFNARQHALRERGTVIFSNAPVVDE